MNAPTIVVPFPGAVVALERPHACPHCETSDMLVEAVMVSGWRSVNSQLEHEPDHDQGADWNIVEPLDKYVCTTCGWCGVRDELATVNPDGTIVIPPHPDQLNLDGEETT